jgi:hypothetical protein
VARKATPIPELPPASILDEVYPQPAAPSAPTQGRAAPAAGPATERRVPVKLSPEVASEARAAVLFLRGHGAPTATLTGLVETAIRRYLAELREELNGGQDFPPATTELPRGRPLGSGQRP